jgi:uncharacterized LabA/DUF88 family protein
MDKHRIFKSIKELKIAVLIDSENISAKNIEFIMKESTKYGLLTIKRIYGDWTDTKLSSWKSALPKHAIQPIQQFKNTSGKNSTDSALIIDAMDILYSGSVDSFILVSSDSDYTRLSTRLRESGKLVVGIGEKKTPVSLVNACNEFKYIENIEKNFENFKKELITSKTIENKEDKCLNLIYEAYNMIDQEDEWKNLSTLANHLKRLDPGFDTQSYGFPKLSLLIKYYKNIFDLKVDDDKRTFVIKRK